MKTANGKNKLERLINKAYKYLNITLKKASNKYLYIEKVDENDNEMVLLAPLQSAKLVSTKYGSKYAINVDNIEETIWVASFAAIELNNYHNDLIIFKINKNYVSENLWKNIEEALKGFDDIWLVSEFIKKKTIYVLQSANKHIDKNLNLLYSY